MFFNAGHEHLTRNEWLENVFEWSSMLLWCVVFTLGVVYENLFVF